MKKNIKKILLFIILIIGFYLIPNNTYAYTMSTPINSIEHNGSGTEIAKKIDFYNVTSNFENSSFIIKCYIRNYFNHKIDYKVTANYYNNNEEIIANSTTTNVAEPELNDFSISIDKTKVDLAKIEYYSFEVTIDDNLLYDDRDTIYNSNENSNTDNNNSSINNNIDNSNTNNNIDNSNTNNYDYYIDKYNIKIIVNKNNTYDVIETITANFNTNKHGIIRKIPIRNKISRLDGTTSTNRAQILNIKVNKDYEKDISNDYLELKIGDPAKTVIGKQVYKIRYTYNIGKDPLKNKDELYYNIIGTEWDTYIKNITFSITMPKSFDTSKLGFSSGTNGSTDNNKISYTIDGKMIIGKYIGTLNKEEGITIRCELPEGYFVGAGYIINYVELLPYLLIILFLIAAIIIRYKYGQNEPVIDTVEFSPPEGKNSLEVAYLYKGKANVNDVTSLLIYLANKGYIQITELNKSKTSLIPKNYKFTKLKEYDGTNYYEKKFFKGLFMNNKKEVTIDDLYEDDFYFANEKIIEKINSTENQKKIFDEKSINMRKYLLALIIMSYVIIVTIPTLIFKNNIICLIFLISFPIAGTKIMLTPSFDKIETIYVNGIATKSKLGNIIYGGIFAIMPYIILIPFFIDDILNSPIYLYGFIMGLCCIAIMLYCLKCLPKRTEYGNEMLGKIKGFKDFLKTAEKEKLESFVEKEPSYFYDILPYTYVLGISDKWIKNFENISIREPSWYNSSDTFDILTFSSSMSSMINATSYAISPSYESSTSDGGFSGGGSSGGGSGGGGGSSW